LANLLLARLASRGGELATRMALGASRARILSEALAETSVLAALGGALGIALAAAGVRALAAYGPDALQLGADARLSVPALLFALAASAATGLVCAIVPVWHAWNRDAAGELQQHARSASGGGRTARARQILVGVEMALSTALLASSALLLHSFVN